MPNSSVSPVGFSAQAWWTSAVIYQIYPRSFADANGDGIDAMLLAATNLDMKVIVDLVPNHTSDEHVWFQEALASAPGSHERDRYMFRQGRDVVAGTGDGNLAPNNWKSIFGGPAWSRVTEANGAPGEWYLHLLDTKQPDLNWDNTEVKDEMRSVMRFWLDRGVAGSTLELYRSAVAFRRANGLGSETFQWAEVHTMTLVSGPLASEAVAELPPNCAACLIRK